MHGDDYELNTLLNYAIVTCAISFARIVPLLERWLGNLLARQFEGRHSKVWRRR